MDKPFTIVVPVMYAYSMMKMSEAIESFNEFLDEDGGDVILLGVEYSRSYLLRAADPIAYRCGFYDYVDAMGIDSDDLVEDAWLP